MPKPIKDLVSTASTFFFGNFIPMLGNIVSALHGAVVTLVTEAGPVLAKNGGGVISSLIQGIQNNLPQMISSGLSAIDTLTNTITANLSGVLEKGKEIVKNLADGMYGNTPAFINMISDIISKMISFIGKNLPVVLDAGADMLLSIVKGFVNNLPQIVSSTVNMVKKVTATIGKYLPDILQKGLEIVAKLIAGLIKAIPDLVASVPKIIDAIAKTISQVDWATLGINIIKGIVKGIINGISLIVDAAKQAAGSALNVAKDMLGIHSPSRVFETQVGRMIDLGLAAEIDNNMQKVRNSMKNLSMETVGYIKSEINSAAGKRFEYEPQVHEIDYEKMVDAFVKAGISIELNGRPVGRLIRRYI